MNSMEVDEGQRGGGGASAGDLWGQMIQAEAVDEIADSVFCTGVNSFKGDGVQSRGTEQYLNRLVGKKGRLNNKRKREDDEVDASTTSHKAGNSCDPGPKDNQNERPPPHPVKVYESESELSSGGLSDDSKIYARENLLRKKIKKRKEYEAFRKAMEECTPNPFNEDSPEPKRIKVDKEAKQLDTYDNNKTEPETSAMSEQTEHKRWKIIQLEKMTDMNDEQLCFRIKNRLGEKRLYLIQNAVSTLGKETCIAVFLKTVKILRSGGLRIKKGDRDRTGGGIFMYLIKNDARIDEQKKDIFWTTNQKSEDEERESIKKSKYQKAVTGDAKMDCMKNNILNRMNRSAPRSSSNCVWNLDENEAYSVVRPKPKPKPEESMPKRKTIDYSDVFGDADFLHSTFDNAEF